MKEDFKDWEIIGGTKFRFLFHRCYDDLYARGGCGKCNNIWICNNCKTVAPDGIQYIADLCKCLSARASSIMQEDILISEKETKGSYK